MKCTVPPALDLTCNDKMRGLGRVGQALRYALNRKGLPGLPAAPIRAYIRTRAGLEAPDAALSWIPFLVGENFHLARTSGDAVPACPQSSSSADNAAARHTCRTPR